MPARVVDGVLSKKENPTNADAVGIVKAVGIAAVLAVGVVLLGFLALKMIVAGDMGSSKTYHLGGFLLFYSFVSFFFLMIPFPWVCAGLPMKAIVKGTAWGLGWLAICSLAVCLLEAAGPVGDGSSLGLRRTMISAVSLAGPLMAWLVWAPLAWWLHRRGEKRGRASRSAAGGTTAGQD